MKMIKKMFLSLMLAVMVSVLFGSVSMAATSTVAAKIGSKSYSSLSAAFKAANNNDTIVLQKNVAYKKVLSFNRSGKSVTLDLNQHTITFKSSEAYLYVENGTLIIKNGTVKQTGAIYDENLSPQISCTVIKTAESGTLKIKSGTYKGELINQGKLVISGGTFSNVSVLTYSGSQSYSLYGNLINNTGSLTISGGTFKKTAKSFNSGILLLNKGTAKISGGTFTVNGGAMITNRKKLTITSGNFTAKGEGYAYSGSSLLYSAGTDAVVSIKGGKFIVKQHRPYIVCNYLGKVTISGGELINESSDGDGIVTNGGRITVKGGSILVNGDVFISYPYDSQSGISYGLITITDGTFETIGTDKIVLYATNGAKIKVTGGTFIGANAYKYSCLKDYDGGKKGTVTISGGTFNVKYEEYK